MFLPHGFFLRSHSLAVIKSVFYSYKNCVTWCSSCCLCQFWNSFEMNTYLTTPSPHRTDIAYLSFAFSNSSQTATLSECCTPNDMINVIPTYTNAEMFFFVGIHTSIILIIYSADNLNAHMTLQVCTHVFYSIMDFIFTSPLNCEICTVVF